MIFLKENWVLGIAMIGLTLLILNFVLFFLLYKFQSWLEMCFPRLYNKIGNIWTLILIVYLLIGFIVSMYAMITGKVRISYTETGNIYI